MSYIGKVELKASDIREITPGTATASQTDIPLGWLAPNVQSLIVTINGVKQQTNSYTIAGSPTTVTLSAGMTLGDDYQVIGINDIGTTIVPADGTVTLPKISAGTGSAGQFLKTDGVSTLSWDTVPDEVASQTSQSGKYLTTDGSTSSWATVDSLPTQTSNAGKYLVTDGTSASWDRESPNIIINGDFDIWQRGTTFNLTTSTNIYTADRWRFEGNNFTGSLIRYGFNSGQVDVPDGPGYYARWINNTSALSQQFTQRIETTPPHKLSGQVVMMSVWLRSASGTIADGDLTWVGGGGNVGEITTTWTKFTKMWTIPTQSGTYYTVGFNVPDTKTLLGGVDIAHVQLEFGSVATTFKSRRFAQELEACQRYYEKSYNQGTDPGSITTTSDWLIRHPTAGPGAMMVYFKVPKRGIPTMVTYGASTGNSGKVTNMSGGASDITGTWISTGEGTSNVYWTSTGSETYVEGHWTADAEL